MGVNVIPNIALRMAFVKSRFIMKTMPPGYPAHLSCQPKDMYCRLECLKTAGVPSCEPLCFQIRSKITDAAACHRSCTSETGLTRRPILTAGAAALCPGEENSPITRSYRIDRLGGQRFPQFRCCIFQENTRLDWQQTLTRMHQIHRN